MTRCVDLDALRPAMAADVQVVTSDGKSIAAHSFVLATASPVLERMIDRARRGWNSECTIRVLGVSSDAVYAFLHFLYASRVTPEDEEVVTVHGPQLLALSHAYRVGWLKRAAEASMTARLTPEHAVDMLKLARLCDAPRLYLRHFKAKMRAEKADRTWRLLVKKVTRARAMSRLAAARTVPELVAVSWARYSSGGAARLR
uniref:BTB domain-containing protein n=1 Tax=Oryza brachyantha TaxID=4533 RepID=J3LYZ3_ORYBR